MTPDIYNQVIPKELIKVGGMYKEPLLQTVENVRATSSGMGVKLQAVITNKVEGFAYEYQWYVSDFKNGTATPISNANSAEYVAYVGDAEAKYYYCQITCKYCGFGMSCARIVSCAKKVSNTRKSITISLTAAGIRPYTSVLSSRRDNGAKE